MNERDKRNALIAIGVIVIAILLWLFMRPNRATTIIQEDSADLPAMDVPVITIPDYVGDLPPLNYTSPGSFSGSSYVGSGCALCSYIGYNILSTPTPALPAPSPAPAQSPVVTRYVELPRNTVVSFSSSTTGSSSRMPMNVVGRYF